jgi:linoleoyl-CoA desaturase
MSHAAVSLTPAQIEAFGAELDALKNEVLADLGEADLAHMRSVIAKSHGAEAAGRALLHFGYGPVTFLAGVAALGTAKILNNMEIGHNVLHGQYDWTGDPALRSATYDWDIVCTADNWKHFHNYEHHTFTNVLGRDRDIGYQAIRVCEEQPWKVHHLAQPLVTGWLALNFQWGVAMHDLRFEEYVQGQRPWRELRTIAAPFLRKAGWLLAKDYLLFPALALGNAPRVFLGNLLANGMRNVWAFAIIFCGHFPDGTAYFDEAGLDGESRGAWYLRQIRGSANIEGGPLFHVLSGHLSHQIEHHLFPDVPSVRYPTMAERVRAICTTYGVPYNTGSFRKQFGSVVKRILRLSLPSGSRSAAPAVPAQAKPAALAKARSGGLAEAAAV